ncbi:phage minor structural protein [[Clostridium] sordellii]|uniref:hypothetical protein n=1 Tax=Paraclostridium sordellii TaxID=1505 RepID=UPI0005E35C32|nr:hypothetical protein [Paeniclostridium sordellii]CEN81341.1 phage minor structural protein [[Clostridium] sordellii] [Paeniclostridium sordellii]CEO09401.1 phage minor structural protein [[Clostridium] sordellii] [Paeniclostridium sordellii]
MIQNRDGSLQIDLSGTNGVNFLKNGIRSIELAGNKMKFYDWDGIGKHIGEIFSARIKGTEIPGLILSNSTDGYSGIAYESKDTFDSYPFYIKFDKYNLTGNAPYPIMICEKMCMNGWNLILDKDGLNEIYRSTDGNNFINKATNYWGVVGSNLKWKMKLGNNNLSLYDLDTGKTYFNSSHDETYFCKKDGYKYATFNPRGFAFWQDGDDIFYTTVANTIQSDRPFHVNGDLTVNGNKNCVQKTKHYGERLFYSVEDCESYLTDRSMHLLTVEEVKHDDKVTYERVVILDNIFKDSVNLDLDYTVEIIKQNWGDYRIKEQTKDYFIVESDRKDFTFKYVVTAKRQGFEEERNKEVFLDALKENNLNSDIIENKEYWRLYTEKEGDNDGSK